MTTSLASAVRAIQSKPGGWLHVDAIRKEGARVVLSLALREGRGGRWISGWDVSCRGVRELSVSDLDGGGIRFYRSSHPAARQHATRSAELRCRADGRRSAILGALAAAHVAAVDDWIPVHRYVPIKAVATGNFVVRAPQFLVRVYAKALDKLGVVARVRVLGRKRRRRAPPRVLHLGSSFVVADRFDATVRSKGLEWSGSCPGARGQPIR